MQKCSFDIKLVKIPVEGGAEMSYGPEGFKTSGWCSCFVVVDPLPLGKTFSNIPHLVANDFPSVVAFVLTNKFTPQWAFAFR